MSNIPYMAIDFSNTGTVEAMNRSEFSLDFLGKQKIERATDIRFEEDKQNWVLYIRTPANEYCRVPGCAFSSYDIARHFEIFWLESCRISSTDPYSEAGFAEFLSIVTWVDRRDKKENTPHDMRV